MKKFITIFLTFTLMLAMIATPASAAINLYNPIIKTAELKRLPQDGNKGDFMDKSGLDAGYLTTGLAKDEQDNVIVDTYDGSDTNYFHIAKDTATSGTTRKVVLGNDSDLIGGTAADRTSKYASVYGRARYETIIRCSDPIDSTTTTAAKDLEFILVGFTDKGTEAYFSLNGYYAKDGSLHFEGKVQGKTDDSHLGAYPFGTWLKLAIDVDVPNDTIEFSVTDLSTNKVISKVKKLSDAKNNATNPITNVVSACKLQFKTHQYAVSIADMSITRDTFVVDDVTLSDETDVVASAKMANHGAGINNYFIILNNDGTKVYMNDNNSSKVNALCQKTPVLILAQYDGKGKLLDVEFSKPEMLTSNHAGGKLYVNPTRKAVAGEAVPTETVNWSNVTINMTKKDGYSYAKAFVWNGWDDISPYIKAVSTQAE